MIQQLMKYIGVIVMKIKFENTVPTGRQFENIKFSIECEVDPNNHEEANAKRKFMRSMVLEETNICHNIMSIKHEYREGVKVD